MATAGRDGDWRRGLLTWLRPFQGHTVSACFDQRFIVSYFGSPCHYAELTQPSAQGRPGFPEPQTVRCGTPCHRCLIGPYSDRCSIGLTRSPDTTRLHHCYQEISIASYPTQCFSSRHANPCSFDLPEPHACCQPAFSEPEPFRDRIACCSEAIPRYQRLMHLPCTTWAKCTRKVGALTGTMPGP